MSAAWLRCDTPDQAIDWLDEQLDDLAGRMFRDVIMLRGDEREHAKRVAIDILARASCEGLAEIEKAFQRLERVVH